MKQEHILKKIWKKPELRVLCRGESEENVLAVCKHYQEAWFAGPLGIFACGKPGQVICQANDNS